MACKTGFAILLLVLGATLSTTWAANIGGNDADINSGRLEMVFASNVTDASSSEKTNCTDGLVCGEKCCFDQSTKHWYCCGGSTSCQPQLTSNGCSDGSPVGR